MSNIITNQFDQHLLEVIDQTVDQADAGQLGLINLPTSKITKSMASKAITAAGYHFAGVIKPPVKVLENVIGVIGLTTYARLQYEPSNGQWYFDPNSWKSGHAVATRSTAKGSKWKPFGDDGRIPAIDRADAFVAHFLEAGDNPQLVPVLEQSPYRYGEAQQRAYVMLSNNTYNSADADAIAEWNATRADLAQLIGKGCKAAGINHEQSVGLLLVLYVTQFDVLENKLSAKAESDAGYEDQQFYLSIKAPAGAVYLFNPRVGSKAVTHTSNPFSHPGISCRVKSKHSSYGMNTLLPNTQPTFNETAAIRSAGNALMDAEVLAGEVATPAPAEQVVGKEATQRSQSKLLPKVVQDQIKQPLNRARFWHWILTGFEHPSFQGTIEEAESLVKAFEANPELKLLKPILRKMDHDMNLFKPEILEAQIQELKASLQNPGVPAAAAPVAPAVRTAPATTPAPAEPEPPLATQMADMSQLLPGLPVPGALPTRNRTRSK